MTDSLNNVEKKVYSKQSVSDIPQTHGIYVFFSEDIPVYIGKSVNMRARVRSHIENAKLDAKESAILRETTHIGYIIVDSEFKSLLLESSLIRKYKPKYNVRWRDDKSYLYIHISTNEKYPVIIPARKQEITSGIFFGPFSSTKQVRILLREIRKIIPFCQQKKIGRRSCFYSKINLCNPCPSKIEHMYDLSEKKQLQRQYKNNVLRIIQLLNGKDMKIIDQWYKTIRLLSNENRFEEALIYRNKLFLLESLLYQRSFSTDIFEHYHEAGKQTDELYEVLKTVIADIQKIERIECYDISNLSQKNATASMVVYQNEMIDRSKYKMFRIKNLHLHSDIHMIEEIVSRRLKNSWTLPQLFIIDGGKPQIRSFLKILQKYKTTIPLIGIAKNPDRVYAVTSKGIVILPFRKYQHAFNLVRLLRDESHRFAKKYHVLLRTKSKHMI